MISCCYDIATMFILAYNVPLFKNSQEPKMSSSRKMGFVSIASIVVGSQIGAGILCVPGGLAAYGSIGLFGWLASAGGAILLALIFAQLCSHIPKAGGPHVYVQEAFGKTTGFFIGWGYWLIAWTSNIAVAIAAVSYLTPVLGHMSPMHNLILEILIIVVLTMINIYGAALVGKVELFLTILKCLPLIIIPIGGIIYFNMDNFYPFNSKSLPAHDVLNKTALLTFWCFIGVEAATANAGIVENPQKVIPKAVICGTIMVAFLYVLNCVGVIALVPQEVLVTSNAPYVEAAKKIFGNNIDIYASIIISLACIGTLNAWILTSGQIAYGAARDGLFPAFCGKTNKYGAPHISLLISLVGTIALLFTTLSDDLISQVNMVIDVAVTAFLFVYLSCMLAFLKLFGKKQPFYGFISIVAGLFCLWIICHSPMINIIVSCALILSGLPVYLMHKNNSIDKDAHDK